jgi:AraC-like DNA-binding protein
MVPFYFSSPDGCVPPGKELPYFPHLMDLESDKDGQAGSSGCKVICETDSSSFCVVFQQFRAYRTGMVPIIPVRQGPSILIVLLRPVRLIIHDQHSVNFEELQFCLISDPSTKLTANLKAGCTYGFYQIYFPGALLGEFVKVFKALAPFAVHSILKRPYFYPTVDFPYTGSALIQELRKMVTCSLSGLAREKYIEVVGTSLLLQACCRLGIAFHPKNPVRPCGEDLNAKVRQAASIIDSCPASHHTIPKLARAVGSNSMSLKKGFRNVLNTTIFHYLTIRRMEKAIELLLNTEKTEQEIADDTGYAGQESLIRTFRKRFGCSPGILRRPIR